VRRLIHGECEDHPVRPLGGHDADVFPWDVLRLFAGRITPGEIEGEEATQVIWLGAAAIMLVPIIMVVLSLTVPYPAIRWVSIVASVLFVVFNIAGLPYVGWYDNFLIAVSFVFNGLIIWYAWTSVAASA
jgi:hypothetical protein